MAERWSLEIQIAGCSQENVAERWSLEIQTDGCSQENMAELWTMEIQTDGCSQARPAHNDDCSLEKWFSSVEANCDD